MLIAKFISPFSLNLRYSHTPYYTHQTHSNFIIGSANLHEYVTFKITKDVSIFDNCYQSFSFDLVLDNRSITQYLMQKTFKQPKYDVFHTAFGLPRYQRSTNHLETNDFKFENLINVLAKQPKRKYLTLATYNWNKTINKADDKHLLGTKLAGPFEP